MDISIVPVEVVVVFLLGLRRLRSLHAVDREDVMQKEVEPCCFDFAPSNDGVQRIWMRGQVRVNVA